MSDSIDERTPLLQFPGAEDFQQSQNLGNAYKQFCHLVGSKPFDHPPGQPHHPPQDTIYHRAVQHRRMQGFTYQFTAALTNALLLSQVVLGAALTGLGASNSSRVLITVFGALNTVIAGMIAFLKSRGQPMRARMFRDDLERVVDEIENSATMWLGISHGAHGYDEIDTDNSVTVRSEIAQLTRLYDRAVKTNTLNDPDFYGAGAPTDPHAAALRSRTEQAGLPNVPAPAPAGVGAAQPPAPIPGPSADPDESPATKAPTPPTDPTKDSAKPTDDKGTDDKGTDDKDKTKSGNDKDNTDPVDGKAKESSTETQAKDAPPDGKGKQPSTEAGNTQDTPKEQDKQDK